MKPNLAQRFEASASRFGTRTAAIDPARGSHVTYEQLSALADCARDALDARGVRPGDRVGVSGKSIGTLATILGVMKAGAAYVPVDASAPPRRSASIYADCSVRAIVAEPELAATLATELGSEAPSTELFDDSLGPAQLLLDGTSPTGESPREEVAYVLYTSGSTGKPKGVVHTHASALAFVDWCSREFHPTHEDVFSSHAPFHFDLSILDLYVPLQHGAAVVLIEDELGKQPTALASAIADHGITVWYSTPSILRLLVEYGRMDPARYGALRTVLFAGEVFPIQHLRKLKEVWPEPRYYNLYGPTETNVCTFFELPEQIDPDRSTPYPIGKVCSDDRAQVLDEQGAAVPERTNGELCISGGSVMQGYWNLPERTAQAFFVESDERWYRTGDIVRLDESGDYVFVGRRDRMIKRRGYRIEPGEIEAALYRHPDVSEAAVLGLSDEEGTTIRAFLASRSGEPLSLIALKRWCADNLPLYMIPDGFESLDALPKTSTDKIDYQALKRLD